jgi:hypothetical protein
VQVFTDVGFRAERVLGRMVMVWIVIKVMKRRRFLRDAIASNADIPRLEGKTCP